MTSWLKIKSYSGDRKLERWWQDLGRSLARDSIWTEWWTTAARPALEFYPDIDSRRSYVEIEPTPRGEAIVVHAGLAPLGRLVQRDARRQSLTKASPSLLSLRTVPQLLEELVLAMLAEVGAQMSMPDAPAQLAHQEPRDPKKEKRAKKSQEEIPADSDRLPAAHRRFEQHFTRRIYDPYDYSNDEMAPFGSDEGSDEVHQWAERRAELVSNPTLRYMLGTEADESIASLRSYPQIDGDDVLIGQGFALLRFTGEIDDEGRIWLREALERQMRHTGREEYGWMQTDLDSFIQ